MKTNVPKELDCINVEYYAIGVRYKGGVLSNSSDSMRTRVYWAINRAPIIMILQFNMICCSICGSRSICVVHLICCLRVHVQHMIYLVVCFVVAIV